jgi:hypothetical protein
MSGVVMRCSIAATTVRYSKGRIIAHTGEKGRESGRG